MQESDVPRFRDARTLLMRRILPAIVAITIATAFVRWYADEHGLIGHTTGVVAMTAAGVLLLVGLSIWAAGQFDVLASRERQATRDDLYRLLARSYPDGGTYLFDRNLRYLLVEGRNLDAVGLVPEEFEGRQIWEVLTPEEAAQIEPVYRAALAGETTTFEMSYRDHHYTVTVGPTRDESGEIVGGLALTQRITEHKALRDQVKQLQKMDAIGQLAGEIAHDFNNLLVAIRGYAELAKNDPESARTVEWLSEIGKAADRAGALTRQLLAFSRKEVLTIETVDLNTLIDDTLKMLERLLGSNIEIGTDLAPALGQAKVDAGQINQVLVNLAVNARDAMPNGGKLTIRTTNVVLDDRYAREHVDVRPGDYACITFRDTGIGMDAQTLERIYEPFFTTKERDRGTGLGLSTVYGIVKQSGGHIAVSSQPGRGTTFDVYLPIER